MKKIIILQLLVLATFLVSSQEVISSAGETNTISGYEICWTIGEPVIETISSGSTVLTQGFHQSKLTVTAINELSISDFELKVYPNPTSEFVVISANNMEEKSSYSLFDLSGKLLENKIISASETRINLKNYARGTYLLKLQYNPGQPLRTYKIVKK